MHPHGLRYGRGRELLEDDRRVDKGTSTDVLDIRIAVHPRKLGGADRVGAGRRKLPAVHEGQAAVVGIHEPGKGDRVRAEASEVVEPDHDVLAGAVHRNRGFRLCRRRKICRRTFILAFQLIHADASLFEVLCCSNAGQTFFNHRSRAGGGVTRSRHPIVGGPRTSSMIGGTDRHPGPCGDGCSDRGA